MGTVRSRLTTNKPLCRFPVTARPGRLHVGSQNGGSPVLPQPTKQVSIKQPVHNYLWRRQIQPWHPSRILHPWHVSVRVSFNTAIWVPPIILNEHRDLGSSFTYRIGSARPCQVPGRFARLFRPSSRI